MTFAHYLGMLIIMGLILLLGVYSGKFVKSGSDYMGTSRNSGSGLVAGAIVGTLLGGSATIGTAQLAFRFGFSAIWFTLGGGLGCVVLALLFSKPLFNQEVSTIPELFQLAFGSKISLLSTLLMSLGSLLSIVAQILSGVALLTAITPLSPTIASLIIVLLMLFYILFGGILGAGIVGLAKTFLASFFVFYCALLALQMSGGWAGLWQSLPQDQPFGLLARGAQEDLGAALSMTIGVLSTQTYIQALVSGKTRKTAVKGVLFGALFIPIVGFLSVLVGLYMRAHFPEMPSAMVMPVFVLQYTPPLVAGMILSILLVSLMGTGSGLALGISTMISHDVYPQLLRSKEIPEERLLFTSRVSVLIVLLISGMLSLINSSSMILEWSFISMGLRAAVAFAPLCFALFLPGRTGKKAVFAVMILGPLVVLSLRYLFSAPFDPLFIGISLSFVILALDSVFTRRVS